MKQENLKTLGAVTHTHTHTHTHGYFNEINKKALLELGEFILVYKNNKMEIL